MLTPTDIGLFEAQLHVCINDQGLREIQLVVRGSAQPAGGEGLQQLKASSVESNP
jgi:hypothetical protein